MAASETTDPDIARLAALLRERLEVIADTEFRDRDPDAHLAKLKAVSEEIFSLHGSLSGRIPVRLDHFLTNCSYDKALAFIEG